jgi:hypothetical protein
LNGGAGGKGGDGIVEIIYTKEPQPIVLNQGGWKEIQQVYYKASNRWYPLVSSETINDGRSEKWLIQGTYSWTCPEDIVRVKVMVYGAGGAGTGGAGGAGGRSDKRTL